MSESDETDPVDIAELAAAAELADPAKAPSRSELKNQQARAELEPLAEGERPRVVVYGAITSIVIAISILIGWIARSDVTAFQSIPPAILFFVMAAGMWDLRYWAVLGFEAVMALFMINAMLVLIGASTALSVVVPIVVLVVSGSFFWYTVKALARIQMPAARDRD